MQLVLSARQPFLFESTIQSHGWYQLAPLAWDSQQKNLRKPEQLNSGKVILWQAQPHRDGLHIRVEGRLSAPEKEELAHKVSWMFALESDFSEFYELADGEPRLAHCRHKAYGRLLRSTTLFEDLVRVMMTTNIQWGGTKRLVKQLVTHFGSPLANDDTLRAFPSAHPIAASDEATLRSLGLGYRAPYLLKLAQGVVAGQIDLEAFRDSTRATDEVRKALLKLPGIGPYAAATMLGILGRYDYIGVDTEAVSQVSKHFYGGQPVGEKEINAVFNKWGKYKSLAYWFWDYAGMQQSPMEAWEAKQK